MIRTTVTRLLLAFALLVSVGCQAPESNNTGSNNGVVDATADVAEDGGLDARDVSGGDALDVLDVPDALDVSRDDVRDVGDALEVDGADALEADAPDIDAQQFPLEGFGSISGECDVLDDELQSESPSYVENAIDFGDDPYDEADKPLLTMGGVEIIDDGNAGGSSLYSEVFAYEVLYRCELAELLKTETEISYSNPQGKITDLLVDIDGLKIGVSVTRAVAFPFEDPYTVEQATELLTDKLSDVQASSQNVSPEDAWEKQILHVIAYAPGHEDSVEAAFGQLDASVKADTILWVTVSNGRDAFLY